MLRDRLCSGRVDQTYGAATEAAARHPRAEHAAFAFQFARQVDEQIQFSAADLVIVTQRLMAREHEFADFPPIAGTDSSGRIACTRDFSNRVSRSAIFHRRESLAIFFQ